MAQAESESGRGQQLDRGADQRDAANRSQAFHREFQANGEQQEGHADVGQDLDILEVDDRRASGVGAHDDPGDDVAQQDGQTQPVGQQSAQQGGHGDDRNVASDAHAVLPS